MIIKRRLVLYYLYYIMILILIVYYVINNNYHLFIYFEKQRNIIGRSINDALINPEQREGTIINYRNINNAIIFMQ